MLVRREAVVSDKLQLRQKLAFLHTFLSLSLSLGVACLHRIGMTKKLERAAAHRCLDVGLTLRGSAAAEDHHPIAEEPE
jgi:hypothetical protein